MNVLTVLTVLIVEDERLAREELKRLLQAHPELRIVGEAANSMEAAKAIEELAPDLIFLDIQMPGGSGFDLLTNLVRNFVTLPKVIFTTAFDQYAIRAFDVSALDYLLKPIEPLRLAQAIQKALAGSPIQTQAKTQAQTQAQTNADIDLAQTHEEKVFIKDGERCWFVALDQIILFESEGNYSRVYFDQHSPLLLRSLNQLEERLNPSKFMRISRRQIVNLDYVENMLNNPMGGLTLTLTGGLKVSMSRRRAAEFKKLNRL